MTLANIYCEHGRTKVAEQLYIDCLDKKKASLGIDHPSTLISMHNLANFYKKQGMKEDAKSFYLECLELCETAHISTTHPRLIALKMDLADLYMEGGNVQDAEMLYSECAQTFEDSSPNCAADSYLLPMSHPMATVANNYEAFLRPV